MGMLGTVCNGRSGQSFDGDYVLSDVDERNTRKRSSYHRVTRLTRKEHYHVRTCDFDFSRHQTKCAHCVCYRAGWSAEPSTRQLLRDGDQVCPEKTVLGAAGIQPASDLISGFPEWTRAPRSVECQIKVGVLVPQLVSSLFSSGILAAPPCAGLLADDHQANVRRHVAVGDSHQLRLRDAVVKIGNCGPTLERRTVSLGQLVVH